MASQDDLLDCLRKLHSTGVSRVRAGIIAERLWPAGRQDNANGQVFPLSAGVAGKMLRKCAAVREVGDRQWEILPHRLGVATSKHSEFSRGYYCAVAVLLREVGVVTTDVRNLFQQGGNPLLADSDDVALFRQHGLIDKL